MAKIIGTSIPVPDIKPIETYDARVTAFEKRAAKSYRKTGDKLAGKIFRHPMADGYATYVVVQSQPLVLAHLPTWDAYRLSAFAERGLRLKDVEIWLDGAP